MEIHFSHAIKQLRQDVQDVQRSQAQFYSEAMMTENLSTIKKQRRCEACRAFLPLKPDSSLPYENSDKNYAFVASRRYEMRICRKCHHLNIFNNRDANDIR